MDSDVKWIKLSTDILNHRKIKQIRKEENGDSIFTVWIGIIALAGSVNKDGALYFTGEIPYTDKTLSNEFDVPIEIVQKALKLFEHWNMIEIIDDIIKVSNWAKYQSTEGLDRVREFNRKRQKKWRDDHRTSNENDEEDDSNVTDNVTNNVTDNVTRNALRNKNIEEDIEEDNKEVVEPPVFQIELNDGTYYDVTQSEIDYYSKLYPAVNVMNEMRAIVGWNHGNPKKRKTRSGIKRHINTWLSDKQNKGGSSWNGKRNSYVPIPAPQDIDDGSNPFER